MIPVGTFRQKDADEVAFWNTTASDNLIEIWTDGYKSVPAYEGNQFIEMNAKEVASLYQDLNTTPGDIIYWSIAHRGRHSVDEADGTISSYVEQVLYVHNTADLGSNSYEPITPAGRPGFGERVDPMLGFWMLIKQDSNSTGNSITYPLEKW